MGVGDGGARVADDVEDPPVTRGMPGPASARLTGNRGDTETVAARVEIDGDDELGRRIARSLGYTM